jgi:hypothetical protein
VVSELLGASFSWPEITHLNMVCNRLVTLDGEVSIVNPQRGVEPVDLSCDEGFGDEAVCSDELDDLAELSILPLEGNLSAQMVSMRKARTQRRSGGADLLVAQFVSRDGASRAGCARDVEGGGEVGEMIESHGRKGVCGRRKRSNAENASRSEA